jgi:sugar/nucleoside kinase (ribokinase family)
MVQTTYDILVLGDYFYDLIYSGLPEFPSLGRECYASGITSTGGALYITVAALRRLGANVGWVCNFGDDENSQFVRELAVKEGVDLAWARTLERPYRRMTTALPFDGERAFVTYVDPEPEDFYDYWAQAVDQADYRHLHIGGLMPPEHLLPLFRRARERGATISMDSQDTPLCLTCDWAELLGAVDIFMPNTREARLITKKNSAEDALRRLREWTQIVIVKDGARGAWIGAEDRVWLSPGINAGAVVDTTGAGDCFNAGFLYGYVVEGSSCELSARYGNICGGLSVTGVGGATTAPTLEILRAWLEKA